MARIIDRFQRESVDIILCDIFMPNRGSIFVIQTMRRLGPRPD